MPRRNRTACYLRISLAIKDLERLVLISHNRYVTTEDLEHYCGKSLELLNELKVEVEPMTIKSS